MENEDEKIPQRCEYFGAELIAFIDTRNGSLSKEENWLNSTKKLRIIEIHTEQILTSYLKSNFSCFSSNFSISFARKITLLLTFNSHSISIFFSLPLIWKFRLDLYSSPLISFVIPPSQSSSVSSFFFSMQYLHKNEFTGEDRNESRGREKDEEKNEKKSLQYGQMMLLPFISPSISLVYGEVCCVAFFSFISPSNFI